MAMDARLDDDNPWWKNPQSINDDRDIRTWAASRIRWRPGILDEFDLEHDSVYTLRGARRVGKTTSLKLLAKELMEKGGVDPWCVMYYACDDIGDRHVLGGILRDYLSRKQARAGERRFMLIDEISSVQDWQKTVKRLWDQGRLKDCSIVATGSHTVDVRMAAERLAGRRGEINDAMDKVMYPMKFADYVRARDPDAAGRIAALLGGRGGAALALEKAVAGIVPGTLAGTGPGEVGGLTAHLLDYMRTGGMPRIVEEGIDGHGIDEGLYAGYLNTFLADLERLDKSQRVVRGLAEGIIDSENWPVSWASLVKKSGASGAGTVPRYVELLEGMFVISVLYQYDAKKKRAVWRKDKKIHFVDPFYRHMLAGWLLNADADYQALRLLDGRKGQGHMAEGIVANHLIRAAFARSTKKPWFDHTLYLHFWRYGPDREVDFVYNDGHGIEIPIEVKFGGNTTKRDLDGLISFKRATGAKRGLILTRSELSADYECAKIPVALFLMLV